MAKHNRLPQPNRPDTTGAAMKWRLKLGLRPLIVSSGMRRSGSTLLYNMLRGILAEKFGDAVTACWEDDFLAAPKAKAYLVKTHILSPFYRKRGNALFYTYRDARTAAVSALRCFDKPVTVDAIREQIAEYQLAKAHCHLCLKYDDLTADPESAVAALSKALGITADVPGVTQAALGVRPEQAADSYSKESLLHPNHFTGTAEDEWRQAIPEPMQRQISDEFGWWFEECGYPVR